MARTKRAAFSQREYWGKPVPGFGDHLARLVIVGLAPAAHGADRTSRMVTVDIPNGASVFLMKALYKYGFAGQSTSLHKKDGLKLSGCFLTAVVRCAPPKNRPRPDEFANCRTYVMREFRLLKNLRAILVLGRQALRSTREALLELELETRLEFSYGARYRLRRNLTLFCSYHPSRQKTQTGRLTEESFDTVIQDVTSALS
ncbi:MAG: uracil-DNA glycosylase [Chloroflexota bacterium]